MVKRAEDLFDDSDDIDIEAIRKHALSVLEKLKSLKEQSDEKVRGVEDAEIHKPCEKVKENVV